jgi:3-hydroxyisobutyrate dehydrogenase
LPQELPGADAPRVGFVGLGSQGGPMARRIVDAGYLTTLWARRPQTLEAFADTPAKTVSTLPEMGAASDLVGICVVNDSDVKTVVLGPSGILAGMAEGGTIVVHSTVSPGTCREIADAAGEKRIAVIDAPVSGGGRAASLGELLVMVGGAVADVTRASPVLATFGDPVLHLGPLGSGQLAKLINNALMTAHLGLANDAHRLGASLNLDPAALGRALAHGSGASYSLNVRNQMPEGLGDFSYARLLRKDIDILASVAKQAGADLGTLGSTADQVLNQLGYPT